MRRLLVVLALVACDRAGPEEEPPPDGSGTFQARADQVGGGGFEEMEGSAVFTETGGGGLVVRLESARSAGAPTTLDLVLPAATEGSVGLGEPPAAALCYRSPVFPDGPYRTESGTLTVTTATATELAGALDGTAALEIPTGPDTSVRLRVEVEGTFRAAPGAVGVSASAIRRCGPDETGAATAAR